MSTKDKPTPTRADGFFWAMFNGQWEVVEWDADISAWWMAGFDGFKDDHHFDRIIETPLTEPTNQ